MTRAVVSVPWLANGEVTLLRGYDLLMRFTSGKMTTVSSRPRTYSHSRQRAHHNYHHGL